MAMAGNMHGGWRWRFASLRFRVVSTIALAAVAILASSTTSALVADAVFDSAIGSAVSGVGGTVRNATTTADGSVFVGGCVGEGSARIARIWAFTSKGAVLRSFGGQGFADIKHPTFPQFNAQLGQQSCVAGIAELPDGSLNTTLTSTRGILFYRVLRNGTVTRFGNEPLAVEDTDPGHWQAWGWNCQSCNDGTARKDWTAYSPQSGVFAMVDRDSGFRQVLFFGRFSGTTTPAITRSTFPSDDTIRSIQHLPATNAFWLFGNKAIYIYPASLLEPLGRPALLPPATTVPHDTGGCQTTTSIGRVISDGSVYVFTGAAGGSGCARISHFRSDGQPDTTFALRGSLDLGTLGSTVAGTLGSVPWTLLEAGNTPRFFLASTARLNAEGTPTVEVAQIRPDGVFRRNTLPLSEDSRDMGVNALGQVTLVTQPGRVTAAGFAASGIPVVHRYFAESQVRVTELFNTLLKHYFMTAVAAEVSAIAGGSAGPGWVATGDEFMVWSEPPPGSLPACRFYSVGPNSHFYTINPAECALLRSRNPGNVLANDKWTFEENSFFAFPPSASGTCPERSFPLYRAWNNRVDSNHRFTTSFPRYQQTLAEGFVGEGVAMCVAGDRTAPSSACTRVTVRDGYVAPDAIAGQPWQHRIILGSLSDVTLVGRSLPGWVSATQVGKDIVLAGTPPSAAGDRIESIGLTVRDCGSVPLAIALPVKVKSSASSATCVGPDLTASALPTAETGTRYVSYPIALAGDGPIAISVVSAPNWIGVSTDGRVMNVASLVPVPSVPDQILTLKLSGRCGTATRAVGLAVVPGDRNYTTPGDPGGPGDSGNGSGSGGGDAPG